MIARFGRRAADVDVGKDTTMDKLSDYRHFGSKADIQCPVFGAEIKPENGLPI
jgi:hypothetical protein